MSSFSAGYIRRAFLDTGKAPGSLNELLTRLKALLRWGYKNDLLDSVSYLDKVERFKDVPHRLKIEDKYLERAELRALLESMKVPLWRSLTEFMALTGLRFGEAAALTVSDVDVEERTIHVSKTYDGINDATTSTKTETSSRDVYIQDELLPLCQALVDNAGSNGGSLLFSRRGKHVGIAGYNKYLKAQSEAVLGRRITTHALRHTHASLLAEAGVDIDTISARLGHADSAITKTIYLHITKQLEEKRREQLASLHLL